MLYFFDPDKINWNALSENPDLSYAIPQLEKYPDRIDWSYLSGNINAIHILKTEPKKICWYRLSENPSIFEIDIDQTKIYIMKKAKSIDF